MAAVTSAVVGSAVVGAAASKYAADKGAEASGKAADQQAAGQADQLAFEREQFELQNQRQDAAVEYLTEADAQSRQYREGALGDLAGLYGLEGGTGSQQELIDFARNSPLYAALTGTRDAGEQSIMRNASATGGLRSGNVQNAMYDFNQRLDERALLDSYNQQLTGLQNMAQLPNNTNNIANAMTGYPTGQNVGQGMANIGATQAAGTIAAGQAAQQGYQGIGNAVSGGINNWLYAKNAGLI